MCIATSINILINQQFLANAAIKAIYAKSAIITQKAITALIGIAGAGITFKRVNTAIALALFYRLVF